MIKEPSQDVQELARRLSQKTSHVRGRGRRSPLFWWMWQRADDLRPVLEDKQSTWADVATELPDTNEIRDGRGKRPTSERVRLTWYEVRLAKGWISRPDPMPTLTIIEEPAKPTKPGKPVADDNDDLTTDYNFEFSSPKRWT